MYVRGIVCHTIQIFELVVANDVCSYVVWVKNHVVFFVFQARNVTCSERDCLVWCMSCEYYDMCKCVWKIIVSS